MEKEGNNLFQTNLKGMITLLSEHIYSNPNTFIRKLLQDYADVITVLHNIDESYTGRIDVFLKEDGSVAFQDNGIDLKEEEVHRFLMTTGESSKKGAPNVDDFIGQSGIGLLSCLVATNEVKVKSRSVTGGSPVCWCGKVNGTYQTTFPEEEWAISSRVVLYPKDEWTHLFEYEVFKKMPVSYGEASPYPVYLHRGEGEELVNTLSPVWLNLKATRKELLDYGIGVSQSSALDVFRTHIESGRIEGALYVLPYRTQPSVRNSHKAYLKRMLLSGDDCSLLPLWIFFIRCLVSADRLLSTTSRESFISNDLLKDARREIGVVVKEHPRGLVQNNRSVLDKILDVHHFHIRAIASEDNGLLRLFMDYLPFETNRGIQSFGSIRSVGDTIDCTRNLEDLKQVQKIAGVRSRLMTNAAYTFGETLLKKCARLNQELTLEEISPARLLGQFTEAEGSKEHRASEAEASELLKCFGRICRLRRFTSVNTPVIFVAEEKEESSKVANNSLATVLGPINAKKCLPPALTLNADNEMVQTLLQIQGDNKLFQHVVCIFYVQSLLQDKYPVDNEEVELFSHSLSKLMTTKMDDFINFLN